MNYNHCRLLYSPCCFWYPSSFVILVSRSNRSGLSSDSTYIFDSSYTQISAFLPGGDRTFPVKKPCDHGIPCPVTAYIDDAAGAEPSPPIEPVIVFELIDFHSLLLVRRRHYQCHGRIQRPSQRYEELFADKDGLR